MERLLNPMQLAEALGVRPGTLDSWVLKHVVKKNHDSPTLKNHRG